GRLIEKLVASRKLPPAILLHWMRRCWLYEEPSHAVLEGMLSQSKRYKDAAALPHLLREPLAFAFLLDDLPTVRRLLSDYRELERSYASVLPLARYLASSALGSTLSNKRGEIFDLATLHTHIEDVSQSLLALLRDITRSVAIVGNSACELGSRKGRRIDAHDMVVRFNR